MNEKRTMQPFGRPMRVVTVPEDAPLREAANLMAELCIGSLVVVNSVGQVTGVVTDRDLCIRAVAVSMNPDESPVKRAMTPEPRTVNPATDNADHIDAIRSLGVRRIPVVNGEGLPEAMVTLDDEIRWAASILSNLAQTAQPNRFHGPMRPASALLDDLKTYVSRRGPDALDETLAGTDSFSRESLFEAIEKLRADLEKQ